MPVRLYREEDAERWDTFVMASPNSSGYHLIGWKNVIEKSFRHKTYYILSEDNEKKINGILPIVQLKSLLFGNYGVSLPYFNYGGVCAENIEVLDQLFLEAVNIARNKKMLHLELRHFQNVEKELPVKMSKVSMRLSLPREKEGLWKVFSSKLRSQINRPVKEGMQVRFGRLDELDAFYSVFSINMRDLGTPVYSKVFFQNILQKFPDSTWICTVYSQKSQPVASGFLLGFKETMEIPWASSLRSYNRYSPNMFLYWNALQFACERGYMLFDFGRSTPGEGTYKFKEQWGSKPTQLYWYYWLRNGGPLPEINPDNPKYDTAIKIWQKLPLWFTKAIGPSIVRNLP